MIDVYCLKNNTWKKIGFLNFNDKDKAEKVYKNAKSYKERANKKYYEVC